MENINTEAEAIKKFEEIFGKTYDKLGFYLTTKKTKNGFLVMKWYQRSTWSDCTLEKKVLVCNGKVYENNEIVRQ
jgi:hypothetical protein